MKTLWFSLADGSPFEMDLQEQFAKFVPLGRPPPRRGELTDDEFLSADNWLHIPSIYEPLDQQSKPAGFVGDKAAKSNLEAAVLASVRAVLRQARSALQNIFPSEFDWQRRPQDELLADFTYIWTAEGWLYLAVVLDLYSRRIVGWSMQASMTSQLVADALMMAAWRRGKPIALLHHSDQGSQGGFKYTCEHFQQLLKEPPTRRGDNHRLPQ